jgi:hypothetical protein
MDSRSSSSNIGRAGSVGAPINRTGQSQGNYSQQDSRVTAG